MAQVSSNTLTYDQIYLKIRDFYFKELRNDFGSNQERLAEYKKLLNDIYQNVGGPTTEFIPYIKGEPPVSAKFNKYSLDIGRDLSLISKQIDYLNAKVVNSFNLFSQEVESEKNYVERIASKAKILQMYSQAPAEDIVYVGDSFDNQDQIDVSRIAIGLNPHVENGAMTLPINRIRPWYPKNISIKTTESNGFLGNDHQVIKSINTDQTEVYEFVYKSNPSISSLAALADDNPLTYFEYEGLNVDRTSNTTADRALVSENEFCYLANKKVSSDKVDGQPLNWSKFAMEDNLKLTMVYESSSPGLVNTLTITPYFASMDLVKVSSVKATLQNGDVQEVLASPIYIGTSFAPLNPQIANNYYYNLAVVRFSEIKATKFEVVFEQELAKDIDIHHVYWKPNYQNENTNSPFYGLSRFNPGALSRETYELIEFDPYALIPSITTPNQYKNVDQASNSVKVRLKKKPETISAYAITFDVVNTTISPNVKNKNYFYNFDLTTSEANDFIWVSDLSNLLNPTSGLINTAGSPKYAPSAAELADTLTRVNAYLTSKSFSVTASSSSAGTYIYAFSNVQIEPITYTTQSQASTYIVPVALKRELYRAKRKCIGLRDVSFSYEIYADRTEIVSTPFNFDTPIESLMLSVDSSIDNLFNNKIQARYYISVNDSAWIQISPIQLYANGTSEVLVFNKNVPLNYQIPGVAYLNYPQVANEINKVCVKIEIIKDRSINVTPSIYAYKIIAKVKKR